MANTSKNTCDINLSAVAQSTPNATQISPRSVLCSKLRLFQGAWQDRVGPRSDFGPRSGKFRPAVRPLLRLTVFSGCVAGPSWCAVRLRSSVGLISARGPSKRKISVRGPSKRPIWVRGPVSTLSEYVLPASRRSWARLVARAAKLAASRQFPRNTPKLSKKNA